MAKALIGYTGFVGSNILRYAVFDDFYNSKNIEDIQKKRYDLIVCAGAPGAKWLANKNPGGDYASIKRLMDNLSSIKVDKFVLISTVDVYPTSVNVDEDSVIDHNKLQPYGKHRRMLEIFVESKFNSAIIRLPGLFGNGLKKNIIYDFLHNNCLNMIHQEGVFQFYDLNRLWRDTTKILESNIKLINIATEPISVKEVAQKIFDIDFFNNLTTHPPHYDFHTKYARYWNKLGPYLYSKEEVLEDLRAFVREQ